MKKPIPPVPVQQEIVLFDGGLDLVSPALALKPGAVIGAVGYEPDINGGYRCMAGIERFDGRTRPSDATYSNAVVILSGTVVAGNTITGVTSGATAVVIYVNGTTELIVTKVTGTFVSETINVGGSPVGTVSSVSLTAALTPALNATYLGLAASNYRSDIAAVPGSGPVRGVWFYNGSIYAFRNNVGGTACLMYKATTGGWTQVTFGYEIQFTGATGEIFEGDTVTVGAYTGVVKRALLRTGTWTVSGAGTLVFDSVTGTMPTATSITVGGAGKATSSTASTAIGLSPGGRFEFQNYNFTGSAANWRMYFVDGVNYLSEFDGTRLVPIRTGISGDAPTHLAAHKNHLFVSLKSSVQHSGIGNPYSWTALTGASELAVGKPVTGLLPQTGSETTGALAIFSGYQEHYSTHILYGNSSAAWSLVNYAEDSGAVAYTARNIGFAYHLDTKGVEQLVTTRDFGNFNSSTITRKIQPFIDRKKGLAIGSCIVRATNQYRVFYSDGTGFLIYINGTKVGAILPFDYGSRTFYTVESFTDATGAERILAGGNDGYVYELDRGTSYDGDAKLSYLILSFNSSRSPRTRKRYRRVVVQATCRSTASVSVGYELDYGSPDIVSGAQESTTIVGGGGWYDDLTWDSFNFDSPYVSEYRVDTPGVGHNIGLVVYSESATNDQHTLHGAIMHYSMGRQER